MKCYIYKNPDSTEWTIVNEESNRPPYADVDDLPMELVYEFNTLNDQDRLFYTEEELELRVMKKAQEAYIAGYHDGIGYDDDDEIMLTTKISNEP